MISVMTYIGIVGTLAAVGAWLMAHALHVSGRPTRWAWAAALLLVVVLATTAPLREPTTASVPQHIGVLPVAADISRSAAGQPGVHFIVNVVRDVRTAMAVAPRRIARAVESRVPATMVESIGIIWAAMSAALLGLLAIVYLRFQAAVRRLPVETLHGVEVRVSPTAGPAVVGIDRSDIVMPRWLLHATDEEQQLALAHEREHLAARDPLLLLAGCLAVALLPWHPAAWWMLSRMRLAVEMDCDRRVLACGIPRRMYGSTLIDIAARCTRLPLGVPALADHTTHLERRLIAMTPARISFRRARMFGLGAAALLTLAAACEARLPSSPDIERMDVAAATQTRFARTALGSDTSMVYYIDGTASTPAQAHALEPDDIASIEVTRTSAPGRKSSIQITTRAAADVANRDARKSSGDGRVDAVRVGRADPVATTSSGTGEKGAFEGLVFIDGVRSTSAGLARLAPDKILSVEVLKGGAAIQRYAEPEAAKGVIHVTTRERRSSPE